ncbi:MAG: VIT1/CCC1 transporter family protein [Promethearchaeota archaeon]
MSNSMGTVQCWKLYWRITDLGSLTRRYIVIGAFDGALTIVAIVLGALAAMMLFGAIIEPLDVKILISAGLAAAVGLAISSGWGAYEAERMERKLEIKNLEQQLHRPLDGCMVDSAVRFATVWASFIHGFAPIPAAILPLVPLILIPFDFMLAGIISVFITMVFLFVLGLWMGHFAKANLIAGGLRMALAGVVTAILLVALTIVFH